MPMLVKILLCALVGYLLGSVNTSLVVGKFYGIDIRNHGSGNAGATNTLRTLGKTAALLVSLGDMLKGILACLIGHYIIGHVEDVGNLGIMVAGIFAVIGHNWPIYFGFKGGKGIFTSFAVILTMDFRIGLILLGFFIIIVAFTRFVSLGSVAGAAIFPLLSLIPVFGKSLVFTLFAVVIAMLAIYRHRENIKRLIKGTESKLGQKSNITK